MSYLKNILVAIDRNASADQVLDTVVKLVAEDDVRVNILHVGYIPAPATGGFMGVDTYLPNDVLIDEEAMRQDIHQKIKAQAIKLNLKSVTVFVEFGNTVDAILNTAKREAVDLIVLGSHGRHGVGLLLGSTANGVLHRAECDVLAVRIK